MNQTNELAQLIQRYNVRTPRYTSYPTAVQFHEKFDRLTVNQALHNLVKAPVDLSLYVHLPFCRSLCWYCGCTRVITGKLAEANVYLEYIEKEIRLQKLSIHSDSIVKQIHFGGGTPNFLSADQLLRLGELIKANFKISDQVEFSVELDPRLLKQDQVIALRDIGCNRASLGIQDVNAKVQKAIHRIQPMQQNLSAVELLRQYGIQDINLDLIYGLPEQGLPDFQHTLSECLKLEPDRLAIYSYAHLPELMPAQRLFTTESLPAASEKIKMLTYAIEFLPAHGYAHIGMDHFARSNDALCAALQSGTLHRNFQGYSTLAGLEMLALGMSAISERSCYYVQNSKDLKQYYALLDQQQLPICRILELTEQDILRGSLISKIMCGNSLVLNKLSAAQIEVFNLVVDLHRDNLKQLADDGLIELSEQSLKVTQLGRLFVRNIASLFDQYLEVKPQQAYSQAV